MTAPGARTRRAPEGGGSLTWRLTLASAAVAFLVVVVAIGILDLTLASALEREVDGRLADAVLAVRRLLREHPDDARALRREVEREWGDHVETRVYLRVQTPEGVVLAETPTFSARLAGRPDLPVAEADALPGPGHAFVGPAGHRLRLVAAEARLGPAGAPRVVIVAVDAGREDDLVAAFRERVAVVLAVALVACAAGSLALVRAGLRPVSALAGAARAIDAAALDQRLALPGLPRELVVLRDAFNDVLDRLEAAFERLNRFSADIAHELRTPLNNLRGEAEVAIGRERTPEEYREVLASALEEYARMARLVERLLFVAWADAPGARAAREPVDVAALVEGVRAYHEAQAVEGGVTLVVEAPGPVPARGDPSLLRAAAGNLVENALRHTPRGGRVVLRAAALPGGGAALEVEDTGPGIAPEHQAHVFDRFFRVDPARSPHRGGVGLGLAIVRSVALLHGGEATCRSEVGRGTTMRLTLPA